MKDATISALLDLNRLILPEIWALVCADQAAHPTGSAAGAGASARAGQLAGYWLWQRLAGGRMGFVRR